MFIYAAAILVAAGVVSAQQQPQFIEAPPQVVYLPPQQPQPVVQTVYQSAPSPLLQYIPPSPLAPPCPDNYICCGAFKHFDPQGVKRCCGDRSYTPSLQSCANGQVVSIVQARPPPPTTPLPVYVQRVELVCEGVKWQVPYPNYRCCGPSVFNVARETCTEDDVVVPGNQVQSRPLNQNAPRPLPHDMFPIDPVPAPTPAPAPTTTKSWTKLLVCQGRRYQVPAADFQFYACCGYESYFWIREQCINGVVNPPRPQTTTTSKTPIPVPILIVCDSVQHWVPSDERPYMGCCGANLYDIRIDTCRAPFNPSNNPVTPAPTCPSGFICCESYPPVQNTNGNIQCCPGIGPYDPNVSNCPNNSP